MTPKTYHDAMLNGMNRLVYFSGMHASGKSTLIQRLADDYPSEYVIHERINVPVVPEEVRKRHLSTCSRAYLHLFGQLFTAHEQPGKHILCDRSHLDQLVLCDVYKRLGWVDEEYAEQFNSFHSFLFKGFTPEKIVFLNPPVEFSIARLEERWERTGRKGWREDDKTYLRTVAQCFQDYFSRNDCLNVVETDLTRRVEIVHDWLRTAT